MKYSCYKHRLKESGNVLFLILIAVALFAALSYAVTQSTRSGGGDADRETNLINSAQLTQYPAGVRTSIVRMIIGGASVDELEFNDPSYFGSLTSNNIGVFHPSGGNATYQLAPPEVMQSGNQGVWYFNGELEIQNIGTTDAGSDDGNDVTAFLPGVSKGICKRINTELGINSGDIVSATTDLSGGVAGDYDVQMATASDYDIVIGFGGNGTLIGTAATGTAALLGQPFGCFQNNGGDYVYYHVLLER